MFARTSEEADLAMDKLLGIRTTGRDESHASIDDNPYEPTPYAVLERIANSGHVRKGNLLVDYGCGKGRVGLFLSHQTRCQSLGIERDRWLYEAALRNRANAPSGRRAAFVQADARDFVPPLGADRFYLFNPFSVEVFERTLAGIQRSLAEKPRDARLLLYYPDEAYGTVLKTTPWLTHLDLIDCIDLFGGEDPRERVEVWETCL